MCWGWAPGCRVQKGGSSPSESRDKRRQRARLPEEWEGRRREKRRSEARSHLDRTQSEVTLEQRRVRGQGTTREKGWTRRTGDAHKGKADDFSV